MITGLFHAGTAKIAKEDNQGKMRILKSLISGVILSGSSAFLFFATITFGESIVRKVIFWNVSIALKLAEIGMLPICEDCELMSLIQVLFWGFLFGMVGYGFVMYIILKPKIETEPLPK